MSYEEDKGPLDSLPQVPDFIGFIDLRTGSFMIAALGVVHIMFYGCTFFMALSYHLVTTWILVMLFTVFSIMLLFGINMNDTTLISIWIWYALVFVCLMVPLMFLFVIVFSIRKDSSKVFIAFLAILWYILTIYFILVVNSHRIDTIASQKPSENDTDVDLSPKGNQSDSSAYTDKPVDSNKTADGYNTADGNKTTDGNNAADANKTGDGGTPADGNNTGYRFINSKIGDRNVYYDTHNPNVAGHKIDGAETNDRHQDEILPDFSEEEIKDRLLM